MNILYLTFYFDPDIGPGAFRNTTLVSELSGQLTAQDSIHVITTQPNRYDSYHPQAPAQEEWYNCGCPVIIHRIAVPAHRNGLIGQIRAFIVYFWWVTRLAQKDYDLVFASSSRLFTAFLGARLSRKKAIPLVLDIRDLFREAILDILDSVWIHFWLNPLLQRIEQYTFGYARHINLVSPGFQSYFSRYQQATYSYLTNGIDDAFLDMPLSPSTESAGQKTILYAGNIGDGQALHTLVPQAARLLGNQYRFVIIGAGGAVHKLKQAIDKEQLTNVEIRPPVNRQTLVREYERADYLFLHLSTIAACKRVLPSKLFEYGATDKPILAGVAGYAASFIQAHLPNTILFAPGNAASLVTQLQIVPYRTYARTAFIEQFQRKTINQQLARHIIQTVQKVSSSELTSV